MNKNSILVLSIIVLSALAQLTLKFGVDWLQFARVNMDTGQWWRFITGNILL